MKLPRRKFLHLAAGAAVLPAMSRLAWAQAYPSRPITMVVPFPAGAASDSITRVIAERMREVLGQPIIVENISGAGGSIGTGRVARSSPDGYSLVVGQLSTHVLNGAALALPYDVVRDFEPVSLLVSNPLVLVGKSTLPANNLKELLIWLKANPAAASMAIVGTGGSSHLAGILLQKLSGTRFNIVPYRGGSPALQDLLGGQVDLMFAQPPDAVTHVQAGRLKGYAVTAPTRIPSAPDIRTMDEAGLSGLQVSLWHGLWTPKGAPSVIIAKLNEAVAVALADPAVRARLAEMHQEIPPHEQRTPAALAALQKAEIEKWWPIIKAAGIKME
jgi:tripartite-type tricarboxylate transporter receptor subunit TctC